MSFTAYHLCNRPLHYIDIDCKWTIKDIAYRIYKAEKYLQDNLLTLDDKGTNEDKHYIVKVKNVEIGVYSPDKVHHNITYRNKNEGTLLNAECALLIANAFGPIETQEDLYALYTNNKRYYNICLSVETICKREVSVYNKELIYN